MCQARKKWVVTAVPFRKPVVTFMQPQKQTRIKITSGFRGIIPELEIS